MNSIYKKYIDYRILIALILIIVIFISFNFGLYKIVDKFLLFKSPFGLFTDLKLLLKGIEVYRLGEDPFLINYDPPYNYPSTWSIFKYFKWINQENTLYIGLGLISITYILLLFFIERITNVIEFLYYLFFLISPVSILIFERGNSDLIILDVILIYFIISNKFKLSFVIPIIIGTALKLFPISWIILPFINYQKDLKKTLPYIVTLFVIIIFILLNSNELIQIKKNTPFVINELTFGFMIPMKNIQEYLLLNSNKYIIIYIFLFLLFFFLLNFIYNKTKKKNDFYDKNKIDSFIIGISTISFSYFLTISWEYREFFFLLCVPFLLDNRSKLWSKTILLLILIIIWEQFFHKLLPLKLSLLLFNFNQIIIFIAISISVFIIIDINFFKKK